MQKKIIALAVAGLVSGAAFADSSAVTVYGVADLTFDVVSTSGGTAANAKTGSYTRVSSNSSHIGFKGSEDIGNGMKAVFQFEHGIAADANAGLAGGRDTYAGLVGGFGAIKLGTLTTPTRALGGAIDVNAGNTGIGDSKALINRTSALGGIATVNAGPTAAGFDVRQANTALYSSPVFSGFKIDVAYISGEAKTADNSVTKANPSAWDMGLSYNNGPIMAGLTYAEGRGRDSTATVNIDSKIKNTRLAGAYNFGQGSVRLIWDSAKGTTSSTEAKQNVWGLGGTFNVSPNGKLIGQYYKANNLSGTCTVVAGVNPCDNTGAKLFEIGYEHSMSKRTILKAVFAQISNDSAAAFNFGSNGVNNVAGNAGVDPRGLQVGIRHSF